MLPNKDVSITLKTKLNELDSFEEELCVETQVEGQRHYFRVLGSCATPIVDTKAFRLLDFSDCLVGEVTSKTFDIGMSLGLSICIT